MNMSLIYSRSHRLTYFFLLLFLFFIPVKLEYSNIFLVLSAASFFFSYPFMFRSFEMHGLKKTGLLFSSVFVLYLFVLLAYFTSDYPSDAVRYMVHRASFLCLPLMFFLGFRLSQREFEWVVSGFVVGTFLKILYLTCLTSYALSNGSLTLSELNYYSILCQDVFSTNHSTFLSFFALLSMWIMLTARKMIYHKLFVFVAMVLFLATILYMESRIIIALTVASLLLYPFLLLSDKVKRLKALVGSLVLLLVVGSTLVFSGKLDYMKDRFDQVYYDVTSNLDAEQKLEPLPLYDSRMSRWRVAGELIAERPWMGYGVGTDQDILVPAYKQHGLVRSVERFHNIHNQYLNFCLESGVFAALFYVYLLLFLFFRGLRRGDVLACVFAVMCGVMSMFENILNTNMMITVFAFMSVALLFRGNLNEDYAGYK